MTAPILYAIQMSPPCRAVFLAAIAIGLDLETREIALQQGEHLKEDFLKMNPQHTIPTLDDNGFVVWDSHAINGYLVGTYGKDDSLYPKDLKKRAIIDQRLHFDSGSLFPLFRGMAGPLFASNKNPLTDDNVAAVNTSYDFLNKFLEGKKWLTGDSYTLADISCLTSVGALDAFVSTAAYPNIVRWMKTCEEELPGYATAFLPGNNMIHGAIKGQLAMAS